MGISPHNRIWAGIVLLTIMRAAPAGAVSREGAAQGGPAPFGAAAGRLQVTGSPDKFTVDADHADALSLLKAIFNQANAQFTTDSSVAGHVTMRLTGQSLSTTLDAVCKQLLIRYRKDTKGIYQFDQDAAAARAAIARVTTLNEALREQLRSLGLALPPDEVLDGSGGSAGSGGEHGSAGDGGPAGPAGGRLPSGAAGGAAPPVAGRENRSGRGEDARNILRDRTKAQYRAQDITGAAPDRTAAKADTIQGGSGGGYRYLSVQDLAEVFQLNPRNNTLQNPEGYRAFLQANGLVYINTGGQKAVVTDVLHELGRQSNTRMLIDPSVPTGPKFSLQGYITPRTLPEALTVLTQSTRLTWRWLGTSIYVSALPDFQLFFNSTTPRVIFSAAVPTQQFGGQRQQGAGAYGEPAQTPLPITNGDKKTP